MAATPGELPPAEARKLMEKDLASLPKCAAILKEACAKAKHAKAGFSHAAPAHDAVMSALVTVRRLLSIEVDPPIQQCVDAGVVPSLVDLLRRWDDPRLQFEAAWAVTNVASGTREHTAAVVEQGAVPLFCELLRSDADDVREQAGWALGNIAGDSPPCQTLCLDCHAVERLCSVLDRSASVSLLRNCCWALTNMVRGKPGPPFPRVRSSVPTLVRLLEHRDEEVRTDAVWALSYLSDGGADCIDAVLDANVHGRVVDLLSGSTGQLVPCLRVVGNVASGSDAQAQRLIDTGVVQLLKNCTNHRKKVIRKEAWWALSNLAGGCDKHVQLLLDAGILASAIRVVNSDEAIEVRTEALWCVCNATEGKNTQFVRSMVSSGGIEMFSKALDPANDAHWLCIALEGVSNALAAGAGPPVRRGVGSAASTNRWAAKLEECGGVDRVEELQKHPDVGVYERALLLLESFFDVADAEAK